MIYKEDKDKISLWKSLWQQCKEDFMKYPREEVKEQNHSLDRSTERKSHGPQFYKIHAGVH